MFPAAETGFDPAAAHDLYSGTVEQAIFETLLTYDYLARPSKLVPLTAEALPEITDDGKTYTFKLQQGHLLHARPGVQGQEARARRRRLRLLVEAPRSIPKIRSPWTWLVEGKIVGLDELAEAAKKTGKFDYDAKIAGLEARRPLHAAHPAEASTDYNLPYVLAHEPTSRGRARGGRGVRRRGGRVMANPVGTGPYKLDEWVRSSKIVLEANPDYRGFIWDFKSAAIPTTQQLVARDEGQEDAAGRPRRDLASWRRTRRGSSRSRTASSTS